MKKTLFILVLAVAMLSCSDNDDDSNDQCGTPLIIDADRYQSIEDPGQPIFIINSNINDECLSLTLGFSGCDDDHTIELITDGAVAESFPVQVFFKLEDLNPQLCQAYFEKVYEYDLDELDDLLGSEPSARLIFPQMEEEVLWDRE